MDHCYASFLEFESNFRPATVFHSACAVTSYYAYLKQRMKTLFQISSLWATPNSLYMYHHIHSIQTEEQQTGDIYCFFLTFYIVHYNKGQKNLF